MNVPSSKPSTKQLRELAKTQNEMAKVEKKLQRNDRWLAGSAIGAVAGVFGNVYFNADLNHKFPPHLVQQIKQCPPQVKVVPTQATCPPGIDQLNEQHQKTQTSRRGMALLALAGWGSLAVNLGRRSLGLTPRQHQLATKLETLHKDVLNAKSLKQPSALPLHSFEATVQTEVPQPKPDATSDRPAAELEQPKTVKPKPEVPEAIELNPQLLLIPPHKNSRYQFTPLLRNLARLNYRPDQHHVETAPLTINQAIEALKKANNALFWVDKATGKRALPIAMEVPVIEPDRPTLPVIKDQDAFDFRPYGAHDKN